MSCLFIRDYLSLSKSILVEHLLELSLSVFQRGLQNLELFGLLLDGLLGLDVGAEILNLASMKYYAAEYFSFAAQQESFADGGCRLELI